MKIVKEKNTDGTLKPETEWKFTYYVPDASGNIMAIYNRDKQEATSGAYDIQDKIYLSETPIYGSSRIGMVKHPDYLYKAVGYDYTTQTEERSYQHTTDLETTFYSTREYDRIIPDIDPLMQQAVNEKPETSNFWKIFGYISYEISNHLGNIVANISDRKIAHQDAMNNEVVNYYSPNITTAQDYYPFGMNMPGRSFNASDYRYGFQNQETDKELWDGAVSYKYRIEDPRLGRFFSVDPLAPKYPWNSTYAFSENKVIAFVELEGLESTWATMFGTWSSYAGFDPNAKDQTQNAQIFIHDFKEVMKDPHTYMNATIFVGRMCVFTLYAELTGGTIMMIGGRQLAVSYAGEGLGVYSIETQEALIYEEYAYQELIIPFRDNEIQIGIIEGEVLIDDIAAQEAATQINAAKTSEIVVQFGKTENQIYHAFRKTDALGLDRSLVQSTIQNHFETVSHQVVAGEPLNQIIEIGGQRIQYTAFQLPDGTFNIGRIHAVK